MFCAVSSLEACNCLSQQIKAAKPLEQKSCINGFILSLADLFNLFRSNCDSRTKTRKTRVVVFPCEEEMGRTDTHTQTHRDKRAFVAERVSRQSWRSVMFQRKICCGKSYIQQWQLKLHNVWLQPKGFPLCSRTVVSWDTFLTVKWKMVH